MSVELWNGDCLEVMEYIPTSSVDLVLCDLPYGTTACKWDSVIPLSALWAHYRRIAKSTIVLTANQPFASALVSSAMDIFKYEWIWIKNRPTGAQHAKNRPMGKHENVLVFSKLKMGHAVQLGNNRMTYTPQGVQPGARKIVTAKGSHSSITGPRPNQVGIEYDSVTNLPHTILNFDKEESHVHPTQKPVALMEYLIRTYTNEGDTVLDNCMGSGTTGVACVNTKRNFIGIEKDKGYFEIAKQRIEAGK